MGDTQHFELLRSEYRQRWDAYQVLAYRNAELAHAGQPPSPVERADEQRAAAAVERARDELLAAVSRLGEAAKADRRTDERHSRLSAPADRKAARFSTAAVAQAPSISIGPNA